MVDTSAGDILADIGVLVSRDIKTDPDGTFMYAEAEEGCVGASLFKDVGEKVICRMPSADLSRRIMDLWEAADADKKWNALFYTITGDQFDARFQFEDGWDPEEHEIDRRPRVLEAKYGNKPIDFSDPEGEDEEWHEINRS
ncbi:MAG: hypothetical protein V4459_12805 [Pseudomonadota bacterium]